MLSFKEYSQELDEAIHLVGVYHTPKKERVRVWQNSEAGYNYSIDFPQTKTKKARVKHFQGSLSDLTRQHSLTLVKEWVDLKEGQILGWDHKGTMHSYEETGPNKYKITKHDTPDGTVTHHEGSLESAKKRFLGKPKHWSYDHDQSRRTEASIERSRFHRKGW